MKNRSIKDLWFVEGPVDTLRLRNSIMTLPPRIQVVVLQYYEKKMTYKQIGEGLFNLRLLKTGVSPERVRQIVSKGCRMLRHPIRVRIQKGLRQAEII